MVVGHRQGPHIIRPFKTMEEFHKCVELQEQTWGRGFSERVPTAILKVSQILGGVAAGAFSEDGDLEGFVFGMTGTRDGELVHWSDMLAVTAQARDVGLGTLLKSYQREQVLALGVQRMFWTFDPLQSRNAHLNFVKLGIVVREYVENMYGETDSPLHRGVGTDRFIAVWELTSPRASDRLAGNSTPAQRPKGAGPALTERGGYALPEPGTPDLLREESAVLVAIPSDIVTVMNTDIDLAGRWRKATRETLVHYINKGYEVHEMFWGDRTSDYLLVQPRMPSPSIRLGE